MQRRLILIFMMCSVLFCFSSCGSSLQAERRITVNLIETDAFSVEENGLKIYPGKDAEFLLRMKNGSEAVGTDYSGSSYIWQENGVTHVLLKEVNYPAHVSVSITSRYRTITYYANGGAPIGDQQEAVTVTRSIQTHLRPNTERGTDLFSRPGYTLLCWNTEPDGSGTRIGLGSRVTVPEEGLSLYAQWIPWNNENEFVFTGTETLTITGWTGTDDILVIPAQINGHPVTGIAADAFAGAEISQIILPVSMEKVEPGSFRGCSAGTLTFFDNIEEISDSSFSECRQLSTLYINAAEAPFGYVYRRESILADKADLLILAQGKRKAVFYGGCSMWFNLDGKTADNAIGGDYQIINMGINGTCSSLVQMEIISHFLEEGDIFFHTPEVSSPAQLLTRTDMDRNDDKLWCGLENNYDLFALVEIRSFNGALDSLCSYLSKKNESADYRQTYTDSDGNTYMDEYGCIPFERTASVIQPADPVYLDPDELEKADLTNLESMYQRYRDMGVSVYVSFACVNLDEVPEEQRDLVGEVNSVFRQRIAEMDGPKMISTLWDYLYTNEDCYDTAYHLQSAPAVRNTACWIRDLLVQMEKDT